MMYRKLKAIGANVEQVNEFSVIAQINEIEREISEARKSKMTSDQGRHLVQRFNNLITPIVPQWSSGSN